MAVAPARRKSSCKKVSKKKASKKPAVRMLSQMRVPAAVERMSAPSGAARFAAGKALAVTAGKDPARVYPHLDAITALLESDSKVVRWNAMQIIAALAPVDAAHKLDAHLETYLAFIRCGNLISAANAIQGAGKIAQCRPDLLGRIVPALLEVEDAAYETSECRNVAIGQTLDALRSLGPNVCRRPEVADFVHRQRSNARAAVARCAERMVAELA